MCYDHLAGRLAVGIADFLVQDGCVELTDDSGLVTDRGVRFFDQIGIDLRPARAQRRCFCRPCRDWSEQRSHIAGAVGARLADRISELGWINPIKDSRAVEITKDGATGIARVFGIDVASLEGSTSVHSSAA